MSTLPSILATSTKSGTTGIIVIVVAAVIALPAFYLVHRGLEYCYLLYGRRFCRKNGLKLVRWRCGPAFGKSGKTEFTILELDCLDAQKQRKLVRLLVWIFGIRKILSDDESKVTNHSQAAD
jgi:hypothetical protein